MPAHETHVYQADSEDDTALLAGRVGAALTGGEYVSLEGDLGAGKTFFARALARSLGIEGNVTSPTFVLQKIYPVSAGRRGILRLVHYDFYRIGNYHELLDLGFEDHDGETVVLAEWGNLFINDFPQPLVRIQIETQPDNTRLISIAGLLLS